MTGRDATTDLRQVFDDLVRFETRLWGAVDARLQAECGTTLASLNAMLVIARTPLCRVLDIAEALAITVGGTSQAVDRLEAAGRCVRRANPEDRRSSVIALTPDGEALLARSLPVFDDELDRRLRGPLGAAPLAHLGEALSTLRAAASRDQTPTSSARSGS